MNSLQVHFAGHDGAKVLRRALCLLALGLLWSATALAQYNTTTSLTDSHTPTAIAPGAPAGSYPLSGFDSVNLFNGHLNFNLPLLNIGGRGGAGYAINLPIEQTWRVKTTRSYSQGPGGFSTPPNVQYYPEYNPWNGIKPGFKPGVIQGRRARDKSPDPFTGSSTPACQTLTRLTFTAANGTEYELRDHLTDGTPHGSVGLETFSRGTKFVSRDGSSLTFISDAPISDMSCSDTSYASMNGFNLVYPSGYLLFPNGTRYKFNTGTVEWIQDRNGNRLTFTSTSATDSNNRTVTFSAGVITFNGVGGAQRTISINYSSLSQALRADVPNVKTYSQLFPLNASPNQTFDPLVVSSVTLTDGRSYVFKYNEYGELARVEVPTGGAFEYDYGAGSLGTYADPSGIISVTGGYAIYRRVRRQRVYKDKSAGASPELTMEIEVAVGGEIELAKYAGSNTSATPLTRSRHFFHGSPLSSFNNTGWYPNWNEGREYQTEILDPVNGNALRVVTNTWKNHDSPRPFDPYLEQTSIKLVETNQFAKQAFTYDSYNNRTDVKEYDFGVGAPQAYPTRHTHIDYLTTSPVNNLNYTSRDSANAPHLLSLPSGTQVYAVDTATGAETLLARSETFYDEPGYPDSPYSSITGWTDPDTPARGNMTTVRRWLNTNDSYVTTQAQYDQAGNLRYKWDAKGLQSQIKYDDAFSDGIVRNTYAYPTSVISPVPDIGWGYSSTTALVTASSYDFSTGLVKATTDPNNQTTTIAYLDPLDRPTQVNFPNGGWTAYEYTGGVYGDVLHVSTLQNSSGTVAERYQFHDGLGRPYRSFTLEGADQTNIYLTTDTQYDALGRVWRVSNTYRSLSAAAPINPSGNWTTRLYDALGREASYTTPDNAVVTSTYSGNQVTITDQAGKARRSVKDALGRLSSVIEDPVTTANPSGLAYQTDYVYDALDNLRVVAQGGQRRYFMYDSLSRLIRARNPEQATNTNLALADSYLAPGDGAANGQWSLAYSYDANSNLATRTDARGIVSTYTYDNLNRNIRVSYSDGSLDDFYFDTAVNGRGLARQTVHYTNSSTPESVTVIDNYDVMGHPTNQRQHFYTSGTAGSAYTIQRTYDYAGHVTGQTYPSGRTVSYSYDRVGRTASFTGNLGDGGARTYMTAPVFDDAGRMIREQFGTDTPLYNKRHYNVRGQLFDIRLSSVNDDSDWNRGAIVNYYSLANYGFGTSGTDNNGNLHIQQTWIPGGAYTQQNYAYDSLNRLSSVGEYQNGATQTGVQNFTYDRWGNRTIAASSSGTGINAKLFTADAASNRLGVPAGLTGVMSYDANGNLINDTYTGYGSRTYDAENRMVTAVDSGGGQSQYTYDGEGKRVKRQTGGQTTWQVYGIDGALIAEYAANAAPASPQKEYGYRSDELLVVATSASSAAAPTGLGVTAVSDSPVSLSWTPSGAAKYRIERGVRGTNGIDYALAGTSTSSSFDDQGVSHGSAYLYRVCGADTSGNCTSSFSNVALATAYSFADNPIVTRADHDQGINLSLPLTSIKRQHVTQLREAVNAVRHLAGLGDAVWTHATLTQYQSAISADDVRDLRAALGEALTALNLPVPSYTDQTLYNGQSGVWTTIKREHIKELRMGATRGSGGAGSGGTGQGATTVEWLITDQLGTPRMVADQSGSLSGIKRHDYLPFGETLFAGTAGRMTGQGYVADGVRQKFTGKERDNETTLDYFLARYYSSPQGRFTSVDPEGAGANPDDPQSWNGYAYARSSPLVYSDPDGRAYLVCNGDGRNCVKYSDEEFYKIRRTHQKDYGFTGSRDFFESGRITQNGETIATYVQISIDDPQREFIFQMRRQTAPIPAATAAFFGISAVMGTGGGLLYYALAPILAPTVTTLGLSSGTGAAVTEGSLASLSIKQLNGLIHGTQHQLLRRLFGGGVEGAKRALASGEVPAGLTRQTLMVYREMAKRAIENGVDKGGVQALRIKIIDEALKKMK